MDFRILKLDTLIPAEYNPRKKLKPGDPEFEKIKNSITEFGFVDPLIVNSDMTIIGGHQRVEVLKSLGYTEAECVVLDISKEKEKALNIALNKITGEWDKKLLEELIHDLQSAGYDISFTGFDARDFAAEKKTKEDDYDIDGALKEPPLSRLGDIWQLGRHRLICGDSTDPAVITKLVDGKKTNLVITDPPYNVDYQGTAGSIKNDKQSDRQFYEFLLASFKNMASVMDDESSIYVFHSDTEGLNFRAAFEDAGFHLACVCVWMKQALVLGRSPYQWKHEPVLYGWKKGGKHKWYADKNQSTCWSFDRPAKSALHPTMKPIALCAYPMLNSSLTNALVLDPFGGSGSTLIACEQTGRTCYMGELDPKFVDVIVRRYIDQVGNHENVFLLRDGITLGYGDIPKNE